MSKEPNQKLDQLRRKIDQVDEKLLALLQKRFGIVEQIGKEKVKSGLPIYQKNRSREVLRKLAQKAEEKGLSPVFIKSLYALIFDESIRRQKKVKGASRSVRS